VRGVDEAPLSGAAVYLTGSAWPASGTTDSAGRVTLRMAAGGTVTGLWVRPKAGYWPIAVDRPHLAVRGDNVVAATPLDATFDGFPKRKAVGWASQALRLHEIAPTFRGHGVKLALIDSGVTDAHPELDGQIVDGIDLISGNDHMWAVDTLGHGTACAGIISACDNETGIDGMAVDAELYALKVMPGGRVSHLLKALDHCIQQQVDIAQISVGTLVPSDFVTRKIADARNAGVFCVAPAGNTSAGPVIFPASLPTVFAVGAVGRVGTFPPGSHHRVDLGPAGSDGLFVPGFTAAGYEVDICAPGVAVISTVPPDGYAMLDGSGIAAAHITALAALVLAHHDDFRLRYTRGPARVDRLAHLISSSCRPVAAPRSRTGAGMPDARSALATIEPVPLDWASAVISHLHVDLARAALIPTGAIWPPGPPTP
jgi:subtilisin family serine protease